MAVNINDFLNYYDKTVKKSIANGGLLDYMTNFLETQFTTWGLTRPEKIAAMAQILGDLTTKFNETAVQAALELIKTELTKDLENAKLAQDRALEEAKMAQNTPLINAEVNFNKARETLVKNQAQTETAKKLAVERETDSYDDNLRIKAGEMLANAVFGYASGGVKVPDNLNTAMFDAIKKITLKVM